MRRNKLSIKIVGAGALDSPLGGVSRFGFFTKLSGGTKRANSVRPYRFIAVGGRVSVVFLFDFQASNKVQEVLFCAIRTSHRVHLTHVDKMFPHTLSLRKVSDLW